jgi:hypothetical protein
MADDNDLVAKRKRAYTYISTTICGRRNMPKKPTDAQFADALGGTIELTDSLRLLREGTYNPTSRLVAAFKREFGKEISESAIDSILVEPFK